jgi:hypothetical protein
MSIDLTPDELSRAIERLEREKQRRAEGKPAAPEQLVTERVFVADQPTRFAPPAPPKIEPRPRRARKVTPATEPQWFYIQMAKPMNGSAGEIAEGWYVLHDGQVFLCNAAGVVEPEGRKVEERGATYTARAMLRAKLSAPQPGAVDHSPIRYPVLKY